jgi:hypothetical protein
VFKSAICKVAVFPCQFEPEKVIGPPESTLSMTHSDMVALPYRLEFGDLAATTDIPMFCWKIQRRNVVVADTAPMMPSVSLLPTVLL